MKPRQRGVTLVELVVVLTVMGLIASIGATLVTRVVAAQQDNHDRLVLAQAADGAVARVADELHAALPNSVRLTANAEGTWVEFIPVHDGGRYRAAPDTVAADSGDLFDPEDPADASFDVIGTPLAALAAGSQLVIGNLGTPDADAYAGTSRRTGLSLANGGARLNFTAAGAWQVATGTKRFFVVGAPLTIACVALPGGGFELARYNGYGWLASQPAGAAALAGATRAVMLTGLADCAASYSTALANIGLFTLRTSLGSAPSKMDFLQQLALDNTP